MRDIDTLGTKLGPKLARLVSQAVIATKHALAPHEVQVRSMATQNIVDRAGSEIADLYRPLLATVLADENAQMHPEVRTFLEKVVSGEHQWHALAGALGTLGQSALSQAIGNAVAPLTYRINELGPNLDLDPQTAAQAVASGIIALGDGESSARQQGYDAGEFSTLVKLAQQIPGVSEIQDMFNRGIVNQGEARNLAQRNGIPPELIDATLNLRFALLPPDLAALAVLRGVISQSEGEAIALQSGVPPQDFAIMIADTGEPPGPQELAEGLRRKFISSETFTRGILQSRVRNEWIPLLLALRYSPMSVADAVNAVVQNHISQDEARSIADQNGLEAGAVDTLIQTAGEPLSRTEMESLYNRGLASKAEVLQALRESRLKDKYGEKAFELHTRLLEPRMLSSAVTVGALTHAEAVKRALEYGFSEADAGVLVNEGSANKLLTYKTRVMSAAESLYEENALTSVKFLEIAKGVGFDESEANFVLQSAEFRRQSKAITAVINAIRSKYIGHHITKGSASGLLDAAGVQANQRDYLLNYWDIELAANVRMLTEAQIVKAHKLGLIDIANAADRLLGLGYLPEDAALLLEGA